MIRNWTFFAYLLGCCSVAFAQSAQSSNATPRAEISEVGNLSEEFVLKRMDGFLAQNTVQIELLKCIDKSVVEPCRTNAVDLLRKIKNDKCDQLLIVDEIVRLKGRKRKFASFVKMRIENSFYLSKEDKNIAELVEQFGGGNVEPKKIWRNFDAVFLFKSSGIKEICLSSSVKINGLHYRIREADQYDLSGDLVVATRGPGTNRNIWPTMRTLRNERSAMKFKSTANLGILEQLGCLISGCEDRKSRAVTIIGGSPPASILISGRDTGFTTDKTLFISDRYLKSISVKYSTGTVRSLFDCKVERVADFSAVLDCSNR